MIKENDLTKQIEHFKLRIKEKGAVNQALLEYLGISASDNSPKIEKIEKPEDIYSFLKDNNVLTNKFEFREFLETISHLWEVHHLQKEIRYKVECLFKVFKEDIKNIFSNEELFNTFLFYKNDYILLILIEQNILSVETILKNIDKINVEYFYTEIRKYNEEYFNELMTKDKNEIKKFVEANDKDLQFFYEVRKGEIKEPKIIHLIKEDKIDEFISFVEIFSIDLNQKIHKEKTIFQTDAELTPIEYSALYGSIAIFKYLCMKKVQINLFFNNNIFEYAIQGRNYEIIHLLEERKEIITELNYHINQKKYLEISIKVHYNEIFEYIMTRYNTQITKEIFNFIIKYRNYKLFDQLIEMNHIEIKDIAIITDLFHVFCQNRNEEIVKILINQPNLDIISKDNFFDFLLDVIKMKKKTKEASK